MGMILYLQTLHRSRDGLFKHIITLQGRYCNKLLKKTSTEKNWKLMGRYLCFILVHFL